MSQPARRVPGGGLNGSKKFEPIQNALNDLKPFKL
jgi:hypothetical protein